MFLEIKNSYIINIYLCGMKYDHTDFKKLKKDNNENRYKTNRKRKVSWGSR